MNRITGREILPRGAFSAAVDYALAFVRTSHPLPPLTAAGWWPMAVDLFAHTVRWRELPRAGRWRYSPTTPITRGCHVARVTIHSIHPAGNMSVPPGDQRAGRVGDRHAGAAVSPAGAGVWSRRRFAPLVARPNWRRQTVGAAHSPMCDRPALVTWPERLVTMSFVRPGAGLAPGMPFPPRGWVAVCGLPPADRGLTDRRCHLLDDRG